MHNRSHALHALELHTDNDTATRTDQQLTDDLAALARLLTDWHDADGTDRDRAFRVSRTLLGPLERRSATYPDDDVAQVAAFIRGI